MGNTIVWAGGLEPTQMHISTGTRNLPAPSVTVGVAASVPFQPALLL